MLAVKVTDAAPADLSIALIIRQIRSAADPTPIDSHPAPVAISVHRELDGGMAQLLFDVGNWLAILQQ